MFEKVLKSQVTQDTKSYMCVIGHLVEFSFNKGPLPPNLYTSFVSDYPVANMSDLIKGFLLI